MSFLRRRRAAAAALLAVAASVAACEGRPPQGEPSSEPEGARGASLDGAMIAEIDLTRGAPEAAPTSLFGAPQRRSHTDLVRALRDLARTSERAPKGLFVRIGTASTGLARAFEVGSLLGAIRKQKPVVCHADEYDNGTLLLAAKGCTKLWLSPAGEVDSVGIAAQLLYANKLLERLHVGVDFLQVGKYKGAEETFTRDGPSPEARETLEGALRGMRAAWVTGISEGRGSPAVAELIEDGPFTPDDAKAKGLVDAIGYADEARNEAKKLAGAERVVTRFGGGGAAGASRGLVGALRALSGSGSVGTPHVTVVPAIGGISMTDSGSLPFGSSDGITERELGRLLERLKNDTSTKAVVIRIDSPGGSALASDLLWKKLMALREKKPVVFSIGEMAASGGYYLACTATKIVADPTSIIGSIGVVGGKLVVGGTLEELGVHAETIPAATDPKKRARAGYMSPFTRWDDPTRQKVLASMQAIYDLFLKRVAEGRGTTVDKIAPSAEGRLFAGVEAKERGLVDEIGGLNEAIDLAIALAKLPKDAPVDVVNDDGGGIFELIDSAGGDARSEAAARARRVAGEAVLPAWSGVPEVAALLGSMAPIFDGERAIAAVPFGLRVR